MGDPHVIGYFDSERVHIHVLRTDTGPFQAIAAKRKLYEYRYSGDRDFKVGDAVLLLEQEEDRELTGFVLMAVITHVSWGGSDMIPEGYCVLGIDPDGSEGKQQTRRILERSIRENLVPDDFWDRTERPSSGAE